MFCCGDEGGAELRALYRQACNAVVERDAALANKNTAFGKADEPEDDDLPEHFTLLRFAVHCEAEQRDEQ